jgi:hypothetical protein
MDDLSSNEHDEEEHEEQEVPVWRLDPESSFSDWTIRVIQSSDENINNSNDDCERERNCNSSSSSSSSSNDHQDVPTNTNPTPSNDHGPLNSGVENCGKLESVYHVHRVYLASGSRKSEYFQTLFSLTTNTEETLSKTTELVLPESACTVFPRFLDYLYDLSPHGLHVDDHMNLAAVHGDKNNDACREIVALAFLADYLRVPKLMPLIKYWMEYFVDHWTIHTICHEALLYKIDWIIDDCINIAAQSPRDLLQPMMDMTATAATISSISTPAFSSSKDSDEASSQSIPPALQTLEMLPLEKKNELLKLSLSNSLGELGRFKRVPSRWKNNIDDLFATHVPKLMTRSRKDNHIEDYRNTKQGCGVPFSEDKICPLFYFDRESVPPALMTDDSLLSIARQSCESSPGPPVRRALDHDNRNLTLI